MTTGVRAGTPLDSSWDAIVIGSGFGGSVMTLRLAEAGHRVLLLERGRRFPPGSFPRSPYRMARALWDPSKGLYGMFSVWSFDRLGAIVGSGLTGAMTAYGFAAAGVKVAVLEAGRVGQGSTAGSPGLALTGMQAEFRDLVERYGLRAARRIAQAMRRAALDASSTLRRLKIRCDLTAVDALHVAVGAEAARMVRRESLASAAFARPPANVHHSTSPPSLTRSVVPSLSSHSYRARIAANSALARCDHQRGSRVSTISAASFFEKPPTFS